MTGGAADGIARAAIVLFLAACGARDVTLVPSPASSPAVSESGSAPVDAGAASSDAGDAGTGAPDAGGDQAARDQAAWDELMKADPALAASVVFATPSVAALAAAEPGRIACGTSRCVVGKEHCCAFRRWGAEARAAYHCQPPQGRVAGADAACSQAPLDARADKWECDDSSDCGASGMCCDDYVNTAYEVAQVCARMKQPGHNVCLWHERCGNGGKCRTLGTTCRDGICVPADPKVPCGTRSCPATSPVCCTPRDGAEPRCAESAASCGDNETPRQCTRGSQCGAGMNCCATPAKQYCSRDCTNAQVICESDAECKGQWTGTRCLGAQPGVGNGTCSK